jgi:hypothetical protein
MRHAVKRAMHNHRPLPILSSLLHSPDLFRRLSVRLLVAGAGTGTAELLGLAAAVVGDEEGAVVGDEGLLELVLAVLVDVFLVVRDLLVKMTGLVRREKGVGSLLVVGRTMLLAMACRMA